MWEVQQIHILAKWSSVTSYLAEAKAKYYCHRMDIQNIRKIENFNKTIKIFIIEVFSSQIYF